ncbi:MAG: HipA domain-containing protein [Oscillospiraceae bacterium]|nr:HipA domain-containing protein [Oscillospiraceae bacterium]
MHRCMPVAELCLDEDTGFILKIVEVFEPEHLPVGVGMKKGIADRAALNDWWMDRSIPSSRSGVREAMETLQIEDTRELLIRCFGLSLSDQYWICPENSGLTWEKVNFFDNDFSDDIGDVLFGAERKQDPLDFSSPDNTSDGNLKKRWKIISGKRCLVKGGSNPYRQQPFNEVIAYEIMKRLDIHCVPYRVVWNKGAPYSVCEDFVSGNTELVPAWRIIQTQKQPNNKSLYQHFIDCAEALGIPKVKEFLDRMIVLDYIIANEDRHLNNFGAVRNAETLEWIGMAPIYDSGSSLGYDKSIPMMRDASETVCKPFKKHHEEQLKLVSSFDWIDFSALSDVGKMITDILSDENAKDYMEERRIRVIAELTERRIGNLEMLAGEKERKQVISTDDEVEKDIAAAY